MKVYINNDNNSVNLVQSVASASTMISSVAIEAKKYVLSKFPKNFFKSVYIDTSETVTQQHINDKYSKTLNKKPYPTMTITPQISLDDPIGGMEKTMHMSSPNVYLRRDVNRTYRKILIDPDQKFALYYTGDYITTNFEFRIATNSFIQNTDVAFYLKSKFQKDFFQFLDKKHVQTEIPKTVIKIIADLKGWNLDDPEDMNKMRLYLIGVSKSQETIQKRKNLSTGKQCFFLNDACNMLTLFTDLDCPASINRDAQVEGEYIITFRLQMSVWMPNAFIMTINKERLKQLSKELQNDLVQKEAGQVEGSEDLESGFYTLSLFVNDVLTKKEAIYFKDSKDQEQIGQLIYNDIYMNEINKRITDVDLMGVMKDDFKKIHSYAKDILKIDLSSLIYPVIYTPDGKLKPGSGEDFIFDYENLSVHFNGDGLDDNVSIAIYCNRVLYETVKKAMEKDKNFFNSNYLTAMTAKIANEPVKVIVRSFVNNAELASIDPGKSIRISTAYGVGYVSLLDDSEEDSYKVCVGFDKKGNPIVKRFELLDK